MYRDGYLCPLCDQLMGETSETLVTEFAISRDEHLRPDANLGALARLKPVFKKDGSVTAGNASAITDGAAALVVLSEAAANRHGVTLEQIDLIELNEAFASQVIACDRELRMDPEKLNVNGGGVSLGHPTGCSGARIVVALVHELTRTGGRYGIATLCVSGGQGMAMLFERV